MAKTKYAFPHDVGHLHEPNTAGMQNIWPAVY
jgi:hypothetical protein